MKEWRVIDFGKIDIRYMMAANEATLKVTTQVPKTTIGGLHYAGTTRDVGGTVIKPGI